MFNVGDMVVYRGYGVGIVQSIEKRQVGENELSFYALKIDSKDEIGNVGLTRTRQIILKRKTSEEN